MNSHTLPEWGNHESTVVPATLRAYRHFSLHYETGGLRSMRAHGPGQRYFDIDFDPPTKYPPMSNKVYQSVCENVAYSEHRIEELHRDGPSWDFHFENIRDHELSGPPNPKCQCGFYASYDPETDFYDGNPGYGVNALGNLMVRGVVEVSGRVIMGTKGIRAEKMQIKALALDHFKLGPWLSLPEAKPVVESMYGFLGQVAAKYGIPAYREAEAMHADFPPQDVSHLIGEDA